MTSLSLIVSLIFWRGFHISRSDAFAHQGLNNLLAFNNMVDGNLPASQHQKTRGDKTKGFFYPEPF
ncbi:hypothetical protein EVH22_23065 [Salmonella enterica subsp. enterica serovar Bareilly]|nr:hypothetical protein [Salmonella enterica subsp. enterica serovar Bareilly]